MAKFRVGQRVRLIAADPGSSAVEDIGREGTIVAIPSILRIDGCDVAFDGADYSRFAFEFTSCPYQHIAPLTPPAEDAWASEAVRKVTKVHVEPVVVKERA